MRRIMRLGRWLAAAGWSLLAVRAGLGLAGMTRLAGELRPYVDWFFFTSAGVMCALVLTGLENRKGPRP